MLSGSYCKKSAKRMRQANDSRIVAARYSTGEDAWRQRGLDLVCLAVRTRLSLLSRAAGTGALLQSEMDWLGGWRRLLGVNKSCACKQTCLLYGMVVRTRLGRVYSLLGTDA